MLEGVINSGLMSESAGTLFCRDVFISTIALGLRGFDNLFDISDVCLWFGIRIICTGGHFLSHIFNVISAIFFHLLERKYWFVAVSVSNHYICILFSLSH